MYRTTVPPYHRITVPYRTAVPPYPRAAPPYHITVSPYRRTVPVPKRIPGFGVQTHGYLESLVSLNIYF